MSLPEVEAAGWANAVNAPDAAKMIMRGETRAEVLTGYAITISTAGARAELASRSGGLIRG